MFVTILLKKGASPSGEGYEVAWDGDTAVIAHTYGTGLSTGLLKENKTPVEGAVAVGEGEVRVDFSGLDDAVYALNLLKDTPTDPYEIGSYYSGPVDNVMMFCRSLEISGDRLATTSALDVEKYQRLVDDAIDGMLCEYYFVPLHVYTQVQPDGGVRRLFPGKIRLLAIHWTAGLLMQSQFQNLEPNLHEMSKSYIDEAKRELQEIVDYSTRIPGQRRKHPCPTMPPNLAPSKTNEFRL